MTEQNAIVAKKLTLAYHHETGASILMLEFFERTPLNVLLAKERAIELAKTILQHYENGAPPRLDRLT
jgi:hypothetical protein